MKIYSDLYASIEGSELLKLLECNENLKAFVYAEADRSKGEYERKGCGSCSSGCCQGCDRKGDSNDAAFLTSALISIFNYYLPDSIKEKINLQSSTYLEGKDK